MLQDVVEFFKEPHIFLVEELEHLQDVLGANIRHFRRLRSLSQSKLAERAGVSVNYISHLEQGIKRPSLSALTKLANALEVLVYQLFLHTGNTELSDQDKQTIRAQAVDEVMETLRKQLG